MAHRTIAGTVNADGTIKHGSEFSVTKTNVGRYLVAFRPAFAQIAGGSAIQIYPDGDTRDNCVLISVGANDAHVKTGSANGQPQDREFSFVFCGVGNVPAKE